MAFLDFLSSIKIASVVLLIVYCTAFGSARSSEEEKEIKAVEHWLPVFFQMMNGSPMIHSPAVWMIGVLCVTVTMFLRNEGFRLNIA